MNNPYENEHLTNECGWCGQPCEKEYCSNQCALNAINER